MRQEVKEATHKWLKRRDEQLREDAIHNALVVVLDMTFANPKAARAGILAAVQQAAFLQFQQRREREQRFPQPRHWVKDGRHMVLPPALGQDDEDDQVGNLPDDRPNPEEELVHKEAEAGIAALAWRLGHDPTWRGELYRLVYVEGKTLRGAATILGISESAAKKRAERLREYLLGTREGKRVVKGRRG
jgi:DNA-directed RNA polymerase specialized sigma24 family protein